MKKIHVAVGVLINSSDQVCIAKRQEGQHLAGLWEFPGGKVDSGETLDAALKREFMEELGVTVESFYKLMDIHFEYPEKTVWLDVNIVDKFSGIAKGIEGQEVRWVPRNELSQYSFPEANVEILKKLID